MKKIFVIALALALAFCMFGCGQDKGSENADSQIGETFTSIPLGGGLGEITLEGAPYGTYKVVDTPEYFKFDNTETTVYEDLNCDTPYIVVFRFAKGENTLETIAQHVADLYSQGYYQIDKNDEISGGPGAFIYHPYEIDGNYYYSDIEIVEDGDDIVEISYFGKTEELQIGDTDVYAWVPVGYNSTMGEEFIAHGTVFRADYSTDYYFPHMFVGKWDYSYEYLSWYRSVDFPEGLPFSEEEHAKLAERFNNGEDDMYDFYKALGDTVVFDSYEAGEEFDYNGGYYVLEGGNSEGTEAWFEVDDNWYVAWFESDLNPKPAYASAFLKSLHTK